MALKINQSLKQSQNLTMTPQLQQAIKLLTLTHLEMTNVIEKEMVENPMLEEIEGNTEKSESDYKIEKLEQQNKEANSDNFDEKAVVEKDDFDWQSYVEAYNNTSSTPSISAPDHDDMPSYENMVSKGQSLADHLEWQLMMEDLNDEEKEFCISIIYNINDDGYLGVEFEELISESNFDREAAIDLLRMVQRFDPVGCGSENLVDCLLSQARIAEDRSPLLEKIIRDHLPDLQVQNFQKIAKTLCVTVESVKNSAETLKSFHPRPGRLISNNETNYIVPDIYVVEVGGEFVVKVNDDGVPRLRISQMYQEMLKKGANKEAQEYVQEKLNSAKWLLKSIVTRQKTIYRVAQSLVRQQQEFFKKGPKFLRPLILKDIANEIGMHESTVSRVTTNKYMHTPIGLFELKYFFNSGIGGKDGGADISSEVLKLKIKELITHENQRRPLADQKIADLLSRDDVKIARRTVAKYREMLGYPSSSKRKIKD